MARLGLGGSLPEKRRSDESLAHQVSLVQELVLCPLRGVGAGKPAEDSVYLQEQGLLQTLLQGATSVENVLQLA